MRQNPLLLPVSFIVFLIDCPCRKYADVMQSH
jgi:hypothetical protein